MKTNARATAATVSGPHTHEGAVARRIAPEAELRRSVMAHMLWENEFYEDGVEIATRIKGLVAQVDAVEVAKIAVEARTQMKLRHVPLWLCCCLIPKNGRAGWIASHAIERVIQRPDEITELVSLYWKLYGKTSDGKRRSLAHALKRGLAKAFEKFDEYALAKYDRNEELKLRDVFFMVHGKTKDIVRAAGSVGGFTETADPHGDIVFAPPVTKKGYKRGKVRRHGGSLAEKLVTRKLETPDTWEVKLTEAKTDAEKRAVWEGLLGRKHLGALALVRNLRNMQKVGVEDTLVKEALSQMKVDRVLPFRFLTAARYAPKLEPDLEAAMFRCLADQEKLTGQTVVVVDVSGSMDSVISAKSEVTRMDAACGLAILIREVCQDVGVVAFSNGALVIPPRHGMALRDAIVRSMPHGATMTQTALTLARMNFMSPARVILITDEQSAQALNWPWAGETRGYGINVGSAKNGITYGKHWQHVDGFSEATVAWIQEFERASGTEQGVSPE